MQRRSLARSAYELIAEGGFERLGNQYLSAEKARRVLDWKPLFDLEEGMRRTVDWYSRHFKLAKL